MLREQELVVVKCEEECVLPGRSDELTLLGAMELCAPSEELKKALSDSYFYDEQFFGTVRSYVDRPLKETTLQLMRAPSMTPKLVRELLRLLRQVYYRVDFEYLPFIKAFDFIKPNLRFKNAVLLAIDEGVFPYESIGEFVEAGEEGVAALAKLPNVGRTSLSAFVKMLSETKNNLKKSAYEVIPSRSLNSLLKETLPEKEWNILVRRVANGDHKGETLEEIANGFSLTRERVRQLEVKALKTLRHSTSVHEIERYLDESYDQIVDIIMHEKQFVLYGQLDSIQQQVFSQVPDSKLLIRIVHEDFAAWMSSNFRKVTSGEELVGWINYRLPRDELQQLVSWMKSKNVSTNKWEDILLESVYSSGWPVDTYTLSQEFPNLSRLEIERFLEAKLGAKVINGVVVSLEKLSPAKRIIYILRDAKRALHTSDIRSKHLKMFGEDLVEHSISGNLGRMEEALIVERGVYNLYENLPFDADEIRSIADKIYSYVETKGSYVSLKVIYKSLFSGKCEYRGKMTEYMVLGIAQDDSRFSIKRGGMIGLNSKEFESTFVSLNDSIYKVVEERGRVTVAEMKEALFMHTNRDILSVTISMIFRESEKYIAVDLGVYDLITRVIGDEYDQTRLREAIEVALLDQSATAFHLMEKLRSVGIDINIYILCSLCSNLENISMTNHLFSMIEPSDEVRKYNKLYNDIAARVDDTTDSASSIKSELGESDFREMAEIDSRLSEERFKPVSSSADDVQSELLDSLVEEFSFL